MEIKGNGRATRGGKLDMAVYATITEDEIRAAVDNVRAVLSDVPLNTFLLIAVGDDDLVRGMKRAVGDGFLSRFVGEPGPWLTRSSSSRSSGSSASS